MSITNAVASVAVSDLPSSIQWYQQLFGRPAESPNALDVAEWHFDGGGRLQVYTNAERAGHGSFTLTVTGLDEEVANLMKHGIDAGRQIVSDTMKVAMIKDPDGNSIAFAEALTPPLTR